MHKTKIVFTLLCFALFGVHTLLAQTDSTKQTSNTLQTGKWRVAITGGLGYLTGSTSDEKEALIQQGFASKDVDTYIKQLQTGYQFSGQAHYMFWTNFGLGIDYNFFTASGNIAGYIDPGDRVTYVYAEADETVMTNYAGLSLYTQSWLKSEKIKLYSQISFGLAMYREELIFAYSPILFTGNAFGGNAELGIEYFIIKNIALGANFSFFQSTLSTVDIDDGTTSQEFELEGDQKLSLTRLNGGLGLRFYF